MSNSADRIILRSREILELPQILDALQRHAVSYEGQELCRRLEPVSDLSEAVARQKETEDTLSVLLRRGQAPLQGLHHIRPSIQRVHMPGAVLACRDLMQIGSFLEAVERLNSFAPESQDEGRGNAFYALLQALLPQNRLQRDLNKSIIGEDELADDASPELLRIRQAAQRSQAQIRQHLERILKGSGDALQEQLITMRQNRYVVPVKIEFRAKVPGIVHDTSQSGQTLFIEPLSVVEENNKLRELKISEEREIERILAEFSKRVAMVANEILENINLLAKADFYWAKARLARAMKASRPALNDTGIIDLRRARHPHIASDVVVPIDLYVGENFRTLLITGPNTGGKTVSLKTCGLLTLMAMCGLQIPAAEHSKVSVFDKVLADIGDEQSIEQSLSTFSSHMRNIVDITEIADSRTLVLTDELGSGTDPSEGAALAVAILEDLRMAGSITVATTHYKELKVYAIQTPGVENAACEFDTETLRPTYKLLIGVPGSSNAFIISRKLGLREDIIDRARIELSTEDVQFEKVLAEVDSARIESEKLLSEARLDRAAARNARRLAEEDAEKLRRSKQDILQEAREESRRALRRQTQEVDMLVREMSRRIQSGEHMPVEDAETLRQLLRGELNEIESNIGKETLKAIRNKSDGGGKKDWKVGDIAFAAGLQLEGKIISAPDNKGQVMLRSGQLQVSVPLTSLQEPPSQREKKRNKDISLKDRVPSEDRQKAQSVRHSRRMSFTQEINIIGQTTADGVEKLDRYLDDAVLAGAEAVRIVHGKGTGALRKAVQDFLARDSRVASWRQAAYGEGDSGVTLAELKNG